MTKQEFTKKYYHYMIGYSVKNFIEDLDSIHPEPSIPVSKIRERIEELKKLGVTEHDKTIYSLKTYELEQLLEEQQ